MGPTGQPSTSKWRHCTPLSSTVNHSSRAFRTSPPLAAQRSVRVGRVVGPMGPQDSCMGQRQVPDAPILRPTREGGLSAEELDNHRAVLSGQRSAIGDENSSTGQ